MEKIASRKDYFPQEELLLPSGKQRLAWVDYARGLAIILVVYRHSMVGLKLSGVEVPSSLFNIQEFILNIRMPVFFVLSGIFLQRSLRIKPVTFQISKRAATLLYPYFLWSAIMITVQIILSNYTNSSRSASDYFYILTQPRELGHMWYLLALFNSSLLYIILSRILKRQIIIHVLIAALLNYFHFYLSEISLLSDLGYYYIFLLAGALVSQNIMELEKKSTTFLVKLTAFIIPFFIAGQLFWFHHINEKYEPTTQWYRIPFLFIVLNGCVLFYCISRLLYNSGGLKWLGTIGKSSLYIYILHVLIMFFFRVLCIKFLGITNPYFIIAGSLALGILIPSVIYWIQKKWKPVHYLFSLEKKD